MGGQHRWAPAYLAACHHIYFIIYYYISSLANKIVVVHPFRNLCGLTVGLRPEIFYHLVIDELSTNSHPKFYD